MKNMKKVALLLIAAAGSMQIYAAQQAQPAARNPILEKLELRRQARQAAEKAAEEARKTADVVISALDKFWDLGKNYGKSQAAKGEYEVAKEMLERIKALKPGEEKSNYMNLGVPLTNIMYEASKDKKDVIDTWVDKGIALREAIKAAAAGPSDFPLSNAFNEFRELGMQYAKQMASSAKYKVADGMHDLLKILKDGNPLDVSQLQKRAESIQTSALQKLDALRKEFNVPADKDVSEGILEMLNKKYAEVSEMLAKLKK